MQDITYEVHLTESSGIESPVTSDRLDFYDSGVWIQTDGGREFYPYARILKIREVDAPEPEAAEEPAETASIEYEE